MKTSEKEDVILIVLGLVGALLIATAVIWTINEVRSSATTIGLE